MARDNSYLIGNQHAKGHRPINAFEKGHTPWNAGSKGVMKANRTSFKPGDKPVRTVEVGTINTRHRNRKSEKPRQFIKIAEPNKWRHYATWLWEQEHGQLIHGDVVHHINGDSLDDRIENLIALPRKDHPHESLQRLA